MELPTVLLISDDAEFSSAVPARWLREARVPAFTLMSGDLCQSLDPEIFDIAIIGDLQSESLFRVVEDTGGVCQSRHLRSHLRFRRKPPAPTSHRDSAR